MLYVDDDDDIREVAELSLQLDGDVQVRTAASGQAAVAILAGEWRPDVLLLDVMMPDADGPTVLKQLRALPNGQAPAIFVTARAVASEVDRLKQEGALGVITKPFDPLSLARQVRDILEAA